MPLVFVHGVATRQTAEYKARVHQRDKLFERLVLSEGAKIYDPDWGSNAVEFDHQLPYLPKPGEAEAWTTAGVAAGDTGIARVANDRPELAVDVAFEAGLAARARDAAAAGQPAEALTEEELAAFEAAVLYLEKGPDKDVFDPESSDAAFLQDLGGQLAAHVPAENGEALAGEAMGVKDTLKWMGQGLKELINPISNVASDAVLRLIRRPLSEAVALFLGDIFVYLRWRDTPGPDGTPSRIFAPIIKDLAEASKRRTKADPLIVVAHSLGAVVLYDLLSDPKAIAEIDKQAGGEFVIDAWITVGAQPALFADMGLYGKKPQAAGGLRPRPARVRAWLNVYDYTDVLSFSCEPIFQGVTDYEFDNVTGLFSAHSAYFQRPSFYSRLRKRLKELNQP